MIKVMDKKQEDSQKIQKDLFMIIRNSTPSKNLSKIIQQVHD